MLYAAMLLVSLAIPPKKALSYYCASGYRVKYHASPTCWGLRNCNARVQPLTLAQLKQQRLEPCRWCHF